MLPPLLLSSVSVAPSAAEPDVVGTICITVILLLSFGGGSTLALSGTVFVSILCGGEGTLLPQGLDSFESCIPAEGEL